MSQYQSATLNISGEPVRVYVYQGRVPLHCGVCGKTLLPGDEYTRHQSPTRWSLSGHMWDDVEIGLRRTSVKPYTACSDCYGFHYDQETSPQNTDEISFARLDEAARTGDLIFEDLLTSRTIDDLHGSFHEEFVVEDVSDENTIKIGAYSPAARRAIYDMDTLVETPAVTLGKLVDEGWLR